MSAYSISDLMSYFFLSIINKDYNAEKKMLMIYSV